MPRPPIESRQAAHRLDAAIPASQVGLEGEMGLLHLYGLAT